MKAKNKHKRRSRQKSSFRVNTFDTHIAKNTTLTIIVIATLSILAYFIFSIIATPEFLIKREIESITTDYYENYFYRNILDNNSLNPDDVTESTSTENNLSDILDQYKNTGFPRITLNQLLLYDNRKNYALASSISEYCDLNKTTIKIFPEPPYTAKNYRVEYNYSCNF